MHLGTVFVLIGAILFFIALLIASPNSVRGFRSVGADFVLAIAGLFTTIGILLGAYPLVIN